MEQSDLYDLELFFRKDPGWTQNFEAVNLELHQEWGILRVELPLVMFTVPNNSIALVNLFHKVNANNISLVH